jgi:hypothetical protein
MQRKIPHLPTTACHSMSGFVALSTTSRMVLRRRSRPSLYFDNVTVLDDAAIGFSSREAGSAPSSKISSQKSQKEGGRRGSPRLPLSKSGAAGQILVKSVR